jgi:putative SOS response-associated peptidase YedK
VKASPKFERGTGKPMCGRFVLMSPGSVLAERFGLREEPQLPPRYNVAPGQSIAAVRKLPEDHAPALALLRWGLIPPWSKEPSVGFKMLNARSETVAEKPAFRNAFKTRRCLIPADGFYEWKKEGKLKQPYFIATVAGALFAFAGLWERWKGPDETVLESCTILTTEANAVVAELHDRMPVILSPETYGTWLDPELKAVPILRDLLQPYSAEAMTCRPVSARVNSAKTDNLSCLDPAD